MTTINLKKMAQTDPDRARQVATLLGLDLDVILAEKPKKRKAKKLPKALKPGEIDLIFAELKLNRFADLRDRCAIQVMYSSGLRISEVTNLTVDDVDLENGYVYILSGKGNKDRTCPIDRETIDWFKKWQAIRPDSEFFFCTKKGGQLDTRQLREKVYRTSKKAQVFVKDGRGKKPVNPHVFRHTCFTECIEEGFTIPEIQDLAGHEDIKTTSVYLSVRPERLKQKMMNRKKNN